MKGVSREFGRCSFGVSTWWFIGCSSSNMPFTLPGSADANNVYQDLSGVSIDCSENPYNALIKACHGQSVGLISSLYSMSELCIIQSQIQALYTKHRETRNAQQKERMLSTDFPGLNIDNLLTKLNDPSIEPGFVDPRNCLVFWARPPRHIKNLVHQLQQRLLSLSPSKHKIWSRISFFPLSSSCVLLSLL